MNPNEVAQQYDSAIAAALQAVNDVENRYNAALQRLSDTSAQTGSGTITSPLVDNPAYKQVADQVKELEGSVARAREQYTILLRQKADGLNRASQDANVPPEQKAKLEADAKQSLAQADEARARAELARAQAANAGAKNTADAQQAQAALNSAQAALQNAQSNLQEASTHAAELSARAPVYAAQAANETAQGGLTAEQAAAAQRVNRQAPTDAQAATANQNAVDLGTANVARTNQLVDQGNKGTLAGLDQWMQAQHEAISGGRITESQADQMLAARMAGTDVYTATQDANKAMQDRFQQDVAQRGQDAGMVNSARGNLSALSGSAFNTTSQAAQFAKHGSGAALAGGYNAMLDNYTGRIGGAGAFQAPPAVQAPPLPPMLRQFAGQPPPSLPMPAPPPAPAPAPSAPSGAGQVTINIGPPAGAPDDGRPHEGTSRGMMLPGYAMGTNFAPGGAAIVGEMGPEVVKLPRGSQVIPGFGPPNGAPDTNMPRFLSNMMAPAPGMPNVTVNSSPGASAGGGPPQQQQQQAGTPLPMMQGKMRVTPQDVIAMYPASARRLGYA